MRRSAGYCGACRGRSQLPGFDTRVLARRRERSRTMRHGVRWALVAASVLVAAISLVAFLQRPHEAPQLREAKQAHERVDDLRGEYEALQRELREATPAGCRVATLSASKARGTRLLRRLPSARAAPRIGDAVRAVYRRNPQPKTAWAKESQQGGSPMDASASKHIAFPASPTRAIAGR